MLGLVIGHGHLVIAQGLQPGGALTLRKDSLGHEQESGPASGECPCRQTWKRSLAGLPDDVAVEDDGDLQRQASDAVAPSHVCGHVTHEVLGGVRRVGVCLGLFDHDSHKRADLLPIVLGEGDGFIGADFHQQLLPIVTVTTVTTIAGSTRPRRSVQIRTVDRRYGGPMPRKSRPKPREVSVAWPDERVDDPVVESVRLYVVALREAMGARSIRSTAKEVAGVDYSTLQAVLAGDAWPDSLTVARTEQGFGVRLWHGPVALPED